MSKRTTTLTISGVEFRISRMGVLTSGPLLAWLQNSFKDTIGAALSGIGASEMNGAIKTAVNANMSEGTAQKIADTIRSLSATLTEQQFREILNRLLFEPECITYRRGQDNFQLLTQYNMEVQDHDGMLVGAIDDPADMFLLLVEVVRHNYADFFPKLLGAIGKLMPKPKPSQQQAAVELQ